jgi:hypothetical protein
LDSLNAFPDQSSRALISRTAHHVSR